MMLKTLGLKIYAILGAVIAALLAMLKYKSAQNERLKDEVKTAEKKETINDIMREAERHAEAKEAELKSKTDGADWRNNI